MKEREEHAESAQQPGAATILLVDDDQSVLVALTTVLQAHGYEVRAARAAGEALRICQDPAARIHLLVTDINLPDLDGRELAMQAQTVRPGLPVLLVSGAPPELLQNRLGLPAPLVRKPFEPQVLLAMVANMLQRAGGAEPPAEGS